MTRHRKFIKSERAKTKLKGAKLPKGLNVTKTEFKVRKIVIRDQIKEPTVIGDGTIVKSNIKDLLTKLQHHNATNRNEGLRYLKEMVTFHQQEASKHLGSILQGICQLALDIEKDVRRECFKALNVVFAAHSAELIKPFFNVVTSYLRCAMTHINMQIQEDSLNLLDCLLLYTPALMAANSDSLFQCFLDMISKLRTETKHERTLTTNLGSKLTSVKWRSKVFDRLLGILRAIVDNRRSATQSINSNEDQFVNAPVDDAFKQPRERSKIIIRHHDSQHIYNSDEEFFFSLTRKQLNKYCDISSLFRKTIGFSAGGAPISTGERDEGKRIQKYVELLMPLLFETWMEVRPAKLNATQASADFDEDDIFISNDAAFSLKIILEIIDQLLELVHMYNQNVTNDDLLESFRKKYGQEFCNQFLRGFPYHQGDGFKGSKRKSKGMATEQDVFEAGGQKCLQQNLNISYIFWILNNKLSNSSVWGKKLIEYLKENLPHIETQTPECLQIVVKVLRTILVDNAILCLNSTPKTKDLLNCVLTTYQNGKLPKEIRTKMLIMLCDIVLDHRLYSAYGVQMFSSWLSTLPKMLTQPFVSLHVLKTFSHLARQKNQIFLKHLQSNQESIISNLATVQVSGVENQLEGKQLIVNLFYWLDTFELNELFAIKSMLTTEWPMIKKLIEFKQFY